MPRFERASVPHDWNGDSLPHADKWEPVGRWHTNKVLNQQKVHINMTGKQMSATPFAFVRTLTVGDKEVMQYSSCTGRWDDLLIKAVGEGGLVVICDIIRSEDSRFVALKWRLALTGKHLRSKIYFANNAPTKSSALQDLRELLADMNMYSRQVKLSYMNDVGFSAYLFMPVDTIDGFAVKRRRMN